MTRTYCLCFQIPLDWNRNFLPKPEEKLWKNTEKNYLYKKKSQRIESVLVCASDRVPANEKVDWLRCTCTYIYIYFSDMVFRLSFVTFFSSIQTRNLFNNNTPLRKKNIDTFKKCVHKRTYRERFKFIYEYYIVIKYFYFKLPQNTHTHTSI